MRRRDQNTKRYNATRQAIDEAMIRCIGGSTHAHGTSLTAQMLTGGPASKTLVQFALYNPTNN